MVVPFLVEYALLNAVGYQQDLALVQTVVPGDKQDVGIAGRQEQKI